MATKRPDVCLSSRTSEVTSEPSLSLVDTLIMYLAPIRIFELKRYFRDRIGDDPTFAVKTPASDELSAGITTVEVVGHEVRVLATTLAERYRIDCRPMTSHGLNGLRISLSIFNTEDQVDVLVAGLRKAAESG